LLAIVALALGFNPFGRGYKGSAFLLHLESPMRMRLYSSRAREADSFRIRRRQRLWIPNLESLEPRQLMAIVPLAPTAVNDAYTTGEDQVLTGNFIAGTSSGGTDVSAAVGLPLKVIEVNGASIVPSDTVPLPSGATLDIADSGSFSYDVSSSGSLSSLPAGSSQLDSFAYTLAPDFSNVFVFGDSLSDQGRLFAATGQQFPPDPPYFQGRISNGPVWVEDFAGRLDLPLSLVNNFAVAGAATSDANYNEALLGADLPGLSDQLQQYLVGLNGQAADPSALYIVWAGANDFFLPFTDPAVVIGEAVTNLATTVGTLQAVGAEHILVMNLPDLGLTPYAQSIGQQAQLTALSAAFNATLQGALAGPGLQATYVDIFSTFQSIVANPATFGLTNVTDAAFNGATVIGDPAGFLFWDSVHPTAAGHQLIADAALAAITSTGNVSVQVTDSTTRPSLTLQNLPGTAARSLQLQLAATDASPADQAADFDYVIDWGDGSPLQTVTAPGSGTTASHTFASGSVQQVSVLVRDQDGDVSETLNQVVTWGTQSSDVIQLLNYGSSKLRILSGGKTLATLNAASVDRLVVFGLGGNDSISAIGLNKVVELDGGAGSDFLFGGNAADILRGGTGDDYLYGFEGNNWLQGDAGNDFLYGGNDDDTLDGGAGSDFLFGLGGNDWLIGGAGLDWLIDVQGRNRFDD
jgi:phospholipase/lecithinase/hemolysin